ncbi:MAG: PilN domain-containing protein [Planctomycetes bacterium]|nr:PilN domain-containing protein [Planctomycetota bacterium]
MSKIDFVPDEYIQQRESNRANLMYLALLLAVLMGMGLTFSVLKIRQSNVSEEVAALDSRLNKAHEQIKLLNALEAKSKTMMKTALITAELPDLVGKSVILATLTNNLPKGVSLTGITIRDTEVKVQDNSGKKTQFQAAKAAAKKKKIPVKILKDTQIELSGTARTDIEVASYIAALDESFLIRSVGLIESTQLEIEDLKFRGFKLKVMLKRDARVTSQDIASIREKSNKTMQVISN